MAPPDFQGIISTLQVKQCCWASGSVLVWAKGSVLVSMHDARSAQENLERQLCLWVAVAYPIWQEVDVKAPDVMQQASARVSGCAEVLLRKAEQQGFLADKLPSGKRV